MKKTFFSGISYFCFIIISFHLFTSDLLAAPDPAGSIYVQAFKKKVQFIDIDFSVWVKGQYSTLYKESKEVENEERSDAVNAGGECSLSTLVRNGLASYDMVIEGNIITLKYLVPQTYISLKGEYYVTMEISPDGKSIKSLNVKFTGGTEIETITYNLLAQDVPWLGSLGKDYDKSQRQYRFKMNDGKPIKQIEYTKVKENPGTQTKFTSLNIDQAKNQMLTVYFYFDK